jgi:hypothetical protein
MKHDLGLIVALLVGSAAGFAQTLAAPTPASTTAPTVIFGITMGRPLPELPKCRKQFASEPPCKFVIGSEFMGVKVYESKSRLILPEMIDGNVESVTAGWESADVCQMAHAQLDAKFGKSTSVIPSTVITGAGIKVDRVTTIWSPTDSTATLIEPYDKVGSCLLTVKTSKWIDSHPPERLQF